MYCLTGKDYIIFILIPNRKESLSRIAFTTAPTRKHVRIKITYRGRLSETRYHSCDCWATCWGRRPCTCTILDHSRGYSSDWG